MYINCHSYHSLRYGTISLEELVSQAKACNITSMALTDINTITGIYDFTKACKNAGIKPIVGMELRDRDNRLLYIALAKQRSGIAEICSLLTSHNCAGEDLPAQSPHFEQVITVYPLSNVPEKLNENEFVGIRPDQLNRLIRPEWTQMIDKLVILQPVTVSNKVEHNLHRILRAIDKNVILSKLTEDDICRNDEVMIPQHDLLEEYRDYPLLIANTLRVMESCNFEFEFHTPKNKNISQVIKKETSNF